MTTNLPNYVIASTNEKTGVISFTFEPYLYSADITERLSIIYFNKYLYIYDSENHYYKENKNEIETAIRNDCILYDIKTPFPSLKKEIIEHISAMGGCEDFPFNNSTDTFPVENGVVKINFDSETVEILPHGPCHRFTYKLSVIYNPEISTSLINELLRRMVDEKDIPTLLQIPAQALLQMQTGNSYKKAYLLQGEPHAGKTSYLNLLYGLFGDKFIASISLQQLCENHFVGGALESCLMNIYDDLEDIALNTIDKFKTLTGGCKHGIERKFQSSYTGKITSVHCFTCNYPPEYPDKVKRDAAFWTRWEYLKFPYEYPVNPNFYEEWYTTERYSSFLNAIIEMMINIKKHGLVSNSDVESVMTNWSINSDPLYDFINSYFVNNIGTKVNYYSKIKLHEVYIKWCDAQQIPEHKRRTTLKSFISAIQQHGFIPFRLMEKKERYEVISTVQHKVKSEIDLDFHIKLIF